MDCGVSSPSMDAINRHRRRGVCPGNMHIDNLEESNGVFILYFGDLLEDNSAPITNILKNLIRLYLLMLARIIMKVI